MEPYLGEIRLFAGNYAPVGWEFCLGQIIPVSQNPALYSLIGNVYGGTAQTTFALPNLAGAALIHQGQGLGLTNRPWGSTGGESTVTLLQAEMPNHTHNACGAPTNSTTSPAGAVWGGGVPGPGRGTPLYSTPANVTMSRYALGNSGSSQPHNNMQPFLGLNYIISMEGDYPSRS